MLEVSDVANQTLELLRQIQAEIAEVKDHSAANHAELAELRGSVETGFERLVPAVTGLNDAVKDLSAQITMLSRGVSVAMDSRARLEERMDRMEARVAEIEGRD